MLRWIVRNSYRWSSLIGVELSLTLLLRLPGLPKVHHGILLKCLQHFQFVNNLQKANASSDPSSYFIQEFCQLRAMDDQMWDGGWCFFHHVNNRLKLAKSINFNGLISNMISSTYVTLYLNQCTLNLCHWCFMWFSFWWLQKPLFI